jgi:TM2 domain-containing membrane protein YozV
MSWPDNPLDQSTSEGAEPAQQAPAPGLQPYAAPPAFQQPQAPMPYAAPVPQYVVPQQLVIERKNPGVSLLISFFIPGLGSMINGKVGIGITILLLYVLAVICDFTLIGLIVGIPLGLGVWIWGLVHAYQSAVAWNAAHGILG